MEEKDEFYLRFKRRIRSSQTDLMNYPDKLAVVSRNIVEILKINNFSILDAEYIFEKILAYIKSQNIR